METFRRHRAFTLIELLVVLSIIALLVAILLPALRAARETAWAAQCLSNQRQVLIGVHTYLADYDGDFMLPAPSTYYERGFNGVLVHQGYLNEAPSDSSTGYKAVGTFHCAGSYSRDLAYNHEAMMVAGGPGQEWRFAWLGSHYGYNYRHLWGIYTPQNHAANPWIGKLDEVHQPGKLYLIGDYTGHYWRAINYQWGLQQPTINQHPNGLHFRHQDRANIAYLDGHAAGQKFEETAVLGSPYAATNPTLVQDVHWKGTR